jgi:hypothetical protein
MRRSYVFALSLFALGTFFLLHNKVSHHTLTVSAVYAAAAQSPGACQGPTQIAASPE